MLKRTIISALMGSTLMAGAMFTANANASFASCSSSTAPEYDITGNVTPNVGCTILEPVSGVGSGVNDNEAVVNSAPGFFNITNWVFDGKFDNIGQTDTTLFTSDKLEVDNSSLFDFSGGTQNGSFTWAGGNLNSFGSIMLVFKDGGDTNLVGYLINMPLLLLASTDGGFGGTGSYTSPFVEPPFTFDGTGPRDISHISVYYQSANGGGGGGGDVPEPGILLLLGAGLVGLSLSRRRRT